MIMPFHSSLINLLGLCRLLRQTTQAQIPAPLPINYMPFDKYFILPCFSFFICEIGMYNSSLAL